MTYCYKTRCRWDEECRECGYPFDPGDMMWESDAGETFCSKTCARSWHHRQEEKVKFVAHEAPREV